MTNRLMGNERSKKNKITFEFVNITGFKEYKSAINVKLNGTFNKPDKCLAWGKNNMDAALAALKYQTYLHLDYKQKYEDLIYRLNSSGLMLQETAFAYIKTLE